MTAIELFAAGIDRKTSVSVPAGIERTFPAAGMRFWNLVIPLVLPGW
jgi:hypothetical protein